MSPQLREGDGLGSQALHLSELVLLGAPPHPGSAASPSRGERRLGGSCGTRQTQATGRAGSRGHTPSRLGTPPATMGPCVRVYMRVCVCVHACDCAPTCACVCVCRLGDCGAPHSCLCACTHVSFHVIPRATLRKVEVAVEVEAKTGLGRTAGSGPVLPCTHPQSAQIRRPWVQSQGQRGSMLPRTRLPAPLTVSVARFPTSPT